MHLWLNEQLRVMMWSIFFVLQGVNKFCEHENFSIVLNVDTCIWSIQKYVVILVHICRGFPSTEEKYIDDAGFQLYYIFYKFIYEVCRKKKLRKKCSSNIFIIVEEKSYACWMWHGEATSTRHVTTWLTGEVSSGLERGGEEQAKRKMNLLTAILISVLLLNVMMCICGA